jgi:hypothetical protein
MELGMTERNLYISSDEEILSDNGIGKVAKKKNLDKEPGFNHDIMVHMKHHSSPSGKGFLKEFCSVPFLH